MSERSGPGDDGMGTDVSLVVVPERPGPLIRLDSPASGRSRDELDELIDEFFPDVDGGPGWFDVVLLLVGAGLVGWGVGADLPTVVVVLGIIVLGLGSILPARSLWRRVQRWRRARRRSLAMRRGVPLQVCGAATERLVQGYDELVSVVMGPGLGALGVATVGAAHSAVIEAASLLRGRAPGSAAEREYVEQRAAAIEDLAKALRLPEADRSRLDSGRPLEDDRGSDSSDVVRARKELEEIAGFSALSRLEELTAEVKARFDDS